MLKNILQQNPSFWLYSIVSGLVYAADICFDLTGALDRSGDLEQKLGKIRAIPILLVY